MARWLEHCSVSVSCPFTILLLLFHVSMAAVSFSSSPNDPSYVKNGSTAKLMWDYSDPNSDVTAIIFNVLTKNGVKGMLVNQSGGVQEPQGVPSYYKGRVRMEGRATLVIEKITPKDNNFFQCKIVYSDSSIEEKVRLIVTEKPQIDDPSDDKSYIEGLPVNVTCTSRGIPTAKVEWLRNGAVLSSAQETASLTFPNISRSDDGNYTCKACNREGCDNYRIALTVKYKPEGTVLTTDAAQNTVTQGNNVTFACHVTTAKPQVSGFRFYLHNLVSNSSNSEYTINNVQRSRHNGEYKCTPYNDAGDGLEATVTLIVNVPAQFIEEPLNITVNTSNPILLKCNASGFPAPSVRWTKSGNVLSSKKQLNISNSKRSDAGEYICTISNGVGQEKTARAYVTVQYRPTIQIATALPSTSWVGQTVTFKCQSDGVPTPTLSWYKPDGSEIKRDTNEEITVQVTLNDSGDFGDYKCIAENSVIPRDEEIVKINQIMKPGRASIISTGADVQASSLTVRWTAPANDGGSPITAYRVIILKGDTEIFSVNVTGLPKTNHTFTGLERETNYTVKVFASNYVFEGDAAVKTLRTKFEGPPEVVKIDELPNETKDDTITLKWKKPGNNGKVITHYTAYQRTVTDGKVGDWKEIGKITDVTDRQLAVKLKKGDVYEFAITATNVKGEGLKQDVSEIKRVKAIGIPAAVEIYGLPNKATEDTITLRWNEPKDNGKKITQYTVYQRTVVDGKADRKWTKIMEISKVKVREFKVKLERGKVYQFAVTATNRVGESSKPDEKEIPQIEALGSPGSTKGSPVSGENGMNAAIYSGAAVAGVLLIIGIVVIIVLWRRRKPSPDSDEMAMDGLGSANHYEADDGYQVSRAEAAHSLQASGTDDEVNYAQVDMTKKKKNRPPPSDEYAQVDKSKKTKKRSKRPGELDYADLEDLRVGLVPGPSGASAAAAVVRPPAYEGTDYADITQFGVPQPDPTYANVSKGDVTYSNMQSM